MHKWGFTSQISMEGLLSQFRIALLVADIPVFQYVMQNWGGQDEVHF